MGVGGAMVGENARTWREELAALGWTTNFEDRGPGREIVQWAAPPALPAGEEGGPVPLVVVLHGCKQNIQMIDDEFGWPVIARERRVALLFVEEPSIWAPGVSPFCEPIDMHCFDWFFPYAARIRSGQPASILNRIEEMVATVKRSQTVIDTRRVFIVGMSAGAGMAALMMAAYPSRFKGAGLVAGPAVGLAPTAFQALAAMLSSPMVWLPESVVHACVDGVLADGQSWRTATAKKIAIWFGLGDKRVFPNHAMTLVEQFAHLMGMKTWRKPVDSPLEVEVESSFKTADDYTTLSLDPACWEKWNSTRHLRRIRFAAPANGGAHEIEANLLTDFPHRYPVPCAPQEVQQTPSTPFGMPCLPKVNSFTATAGMSATEEMANFFGLRNDKALPRPKDGGGLGGGIGRDQRDLV